MLCRLTSEIKIEYPQKHSTMHLSTMDGNLHFNLYLLSMIIKISFISYSQLPDAYRSVKQPMFSSFLMNSNVKQKAVCIFKHDQ